MRPINNCAHKFKKKKNKSPKIYLTRNGKKNSDYFMCL